MGMLRAFVRVFACALLVSCAHTPSDDELLIGAWRSDHESFDLDIREGVILYEFDMQEHPYTVRDGILTVDLGTESGITRARIIELNATTLKLQYLESGDVRTFTRMR